MKIENTVKHTPGPWQHFPSFKEGYIITTDTGTPTKAKPFGTLAHILEHAVAKGEAEGNARLISSAPELLEACEKVLAWHGRMEKDHWEKLGKSFKEACENWDNLLQEPLDLKPMMDAVKKAKGL